ncbi:GIY-YIG nuclease family protein [Spirosoma koreense]
MTKKALDLGQIIDQTSPFLSTPCIYFLLDSEDNVIYVGQTKNLNNQLNKHRLDGKKFTHFRYFPCQEWDLDRREQEAIAQHKPVLNQAPVNLSNSNYLSKSLICLKYNITPVAFERLRTEFGLEPVRSFGPTKYYRPADVDAWLNRFKGLVVRGRHVLQTTPHYLAVGVSARTKQLQLFKER